jgi:endonuclease III related protein
MLAIFPPKNMVQEIPELGRGTAATLGSKSSGRPVLCCAIAVVSPLHSYHRALWAHFAPEMDMDRWWPARSRFEVIIGAILVQNTAWANVSKAMASLRAAGRLSLAGIRGLDEAELGQLIRSSGVWRQKARRLRGFVAWLDAVHNGSLEHLFRQPAYEVRRQLLDRDGIGEETADAILLYASSHPAFILDAYTRRIFSRHGLPTRREWIEAALPLTGRDALRRHRHFHAMLVETAKRYCRKHAPECAHCPLRPWLPAPS